MSSRVAALLIAASIAGCTYQRSASVMSPDGVSCARQCALRYPDRADTFECTVSCPGAIVDSSCVVAVSETSDAAGVCVQTSEVHVGKTLLAVGVIVLSVGSLLLGGWVAMNTR